MSWLKHCNVSVDGVESCTPRNMESRVAIQNRAQWVVLVADVLWSMCANAEVGDADLDAATLAAMQLPGQRPEASPPTSNGVTWQELPKVWSRTNL